MRSNWVRAGTIVLLWVLLALPGLARAEDERLPVKLRVAILFKALTYDRNLEKRSVDGLRIGVIGSSAYPESMAIARETVDEIRNSSGRKVKGLSINAEVLPIEKAADVVNAVQRNRFNLLYLGPHLSGQLAGILRLAREQKILVMSGEPGYVQAGVALGAVLRGRKPKIQVHADASAQGASFDARLLRLAEIVK